MVATGFLPLFQIVISLPKGKKKHNMLWKKIDGALYQVNFAECKALRCEIDVSKLWVKQVWMGIVCCRWRQDCDIAPAVGKLPGFRALATEAEKIKRKPGKTLKMTEKRLLKDCYKTFKRDKERRLCF